MGEAPDEMTRATDASGVTGTTAGTSGASGMAGSDPEPEQLRAEIERTRENLSETLDAISDRLSPGNIVADAKENLKQAATERMQVMADTAGRVAEDVTARAQRVAEDVSARAQRVASDVSVRAREATSGVVTHVRENPWPAAVFGVGLGWLLYQSFSASADVSDLDTVDDRDPYGYGYDAGYGVTAYDRGEDDGGSFVQTLRDNPLPAVIAGVGLGWLVNSIVRSNRYDDMSMASQYSEYGELSERAESGSEWPGTSEEGRDYARLGRDTRSRVAGARARVSSAASQAASRIGRVTSDTSHRLGRAGAQTQDTLSRMVRENPLAAGAIALACGAAVGLAVPASRAENRLMGSSRDALVSKAQTATRDAIGRVKDGQSPGGSNTPAV
jgi:ElaB/YqjD/DUF883 family membrane-anchored ribosome-binding protein